jgi:hypothetical protein
VLKVLHSKCKQWRTLKIRKSFQISLLIVYEYKTKFIYILFFPTNKKSVHHSFNYLFQLMKITLSLIFHSDVDIWTKTMMFWKRTIGSYDSVHFTRVEILYTFSHWDLLRFQELKSYF